MKLLTGNQMKELETIAMREYGLEGLLLMENAARNFVDTLEKEYGLVSEKEISICCGKGNNGGDGFAIARHLHNRRAAVKVILVLGREGMTPDAEKNLDIIIRMGIPVLGPDAEIGSCDLMIDALFGTGFHGEIKGNAERVVERMNAGDVPVVAVDIPSGVCADDGHVGACCVRADLTITFGCAKLGHFIYPGKAFVGKLFVGEISLPRGLVRDFPSPYRTLDSGLFKKLPKRQENSHKGSFGKVLAFAGSPGMHGACLMATTAVLKTGAGMVTAAVPKQAAESLAAQVKEVMLLSLPTEGDSLAKSAGGILSEKLKSQDVLLAGCGLGSSEGTKKALISLVGACEKPMVLDADGINLLKGHIHVIKNKKIPPVLTPHPLEFSRISGWSVEEIQEKRIGLSEKFAKDFGVVLVLKGADTVVASPDGSVSVCPDSNSGMATAGSGDVLSGVIASLLAQGAAPRLAAEAGVYIHSQAGLLARRKQGAYGMTATDILSALPEVMKKIEE